MQRLYASVILVLVLGGAPLGCDRTAHGQPGSAAPPAAAGAEVDDGFPFPAAVRPFRPSPRPSSGGARGAASLVRPEIVVSLGQLSLRLVDRASGFRRSYPVAVGRRDATGRSLTPIGRFATGPDPSDTWWYVPERSSGLPFLRLTAQDGPGRYPYGLHGPRQGRFVRGYVSSGCVRLRPDDMLELFALIRHFAATPVTIEP